jgi:hypothetical protein
VNCRPLLTFRSFFRTPRPGRFGGPGRFRDGPGRLPMTPYRAADDRYPGLPGVVVQPVRDLPLPPWEQVDVVIHRRLDAPMAELVSEVRQDRVPIPPRLDGLGDVETRVGVTEGVGRPFGEPRSGRACQPGLTEQPRPAPIDGGRFEGAIPPGPRCVRTSASERARPPPTAARRPGPESRHCAERATPRARTHRPGLLPGGASGASARPRIPGRWRRSRPGRPWAPGGTAPPQCPRSAAAGSRPGGSRQPGPGCQSSV